MKRNWVEQSVIAIIVGWMLSFLLVSNPEISAGLTHTVTQSFGKTIAILLICTAASFAIGLWQIRILKIALPITIFVSSVSGMETINAPWVVAGFCLIISLAVWYVREEIFYYAEKIKVSDKQLKIIFIILFIFMGGCIVVTSCLRYAAFLSYDMDMGVFSQMYEYMKQTGIPYTTVERNGLISHFKVHISPVLYLLLPIYAIFSSAYTLQIAQGILVAASIWPLYLLARHYKLSNKCILLIGICYSFYPPLLGSCFYDFHENCFVPFFLLFLIWSIETKKKILFPIFMLLTLSVKEDIAVVLIFLALFYILSKKDVKRGMILLISSGVYLLICLVLLKHYGYGILSYLENMYLTETGSIMQVIQSAILNPGYTLRQCFDVKEKIDYMIWILVPLNIAILSARKYSNYILLIPLVLLNLIPDYSCVYSIYFQYSFSVSVLIFYIAIMNIVEWKWDKRKSHLLVCTWITVLMFFASAWQMTGYYKEKYESSKDFCRSMEEMLNTIPKEASVGASNTLTAHLSKNLELYTAFTADTEYIVLDLREGQGVVLEDARQQAFERGYQELEYRENTGIIFKK